MTYQKLFLLGIRRFTCKFCENTFIYASHLKRHILVVHYNYKNPKASSRYSFIKILEYFQLNYLPNRKFKVCAAGVFLELVFSFLFLLIFFLPFLFLFSPFSFLFFLLFLSLLFPLSFELSSLTFSFPIENLKCVPQAFFFT